MVSYLEVDHESSVTFIVVISLPVTAGVSLYQLIQQE